MPNAVSTTAQCHTVLMLDGGFCRVDTKTNTMDRHTQRHILRVMQQNFFTAVGQGDVE